MRHIFRKIHSENIHMPGMVQRPWTTINLQLLNINILMTEHGLLNKNYNNDGASAGSIDSCVFRMHIKKNKQIPGLQSRGLSFWFHSLYPTGYPALCAYNARHSFCGVQRICTHCTPKAEASFEDIPLKQRKGTARKFRHPKSTYVLAMLLRIVDLQNVTETSPSTNKDRPSCRKPSVREEPRFLKRNELFNRYTPVVARV